MRSSKNLVKIFKPINLFYIMSESGVTVFSPTGTTIEDVASVVSDFSIISAIAISIAVSTTQATCLVNDLFSRMKNALSTNMSNKRQALAIYPAISTASTFTSSPVTDLRNLARHGIIVQTLDDQTGNPIYFYIGGVSSAWSQVNVRRIQRLLVFQGGARFTLTTAVFNDQIKYALSSQYPIIVAPLKPIPTISKFR